MVVHTDSLGTVKLLLGYDVMASGKKSLGKRCTRSYYAVQIPIVCIDGPEAISCHARTLVIRGCKNWLVRNNGVMLHDGTNRHEQRLLYMILVSRAESAPLIYAVGVVCGSYNGGN